MTRRSFSLTAFIEQTAKMLRDIIKKDRAKKKNYEKENGLSNSNKISQIASLIRSERQKRKSRKK